MRMITITIMIMIIIAALPPPLAHRGEQVALQHALDFTLCPPPPPSLMPPAATALVLSRVRIRAHKVRRGTQNRAINPLCSQKGRNHKRKEKEKGTRKKHRDAHKGLCRRRALATCVS